MGVPHPDVIVAEKVMLWPLGDGFALEETTVVVAAKPVTVNVVESVKPDADAVIVVLPVQEPVARPVALIVATFPEVEVHVVWLVTSCELPSL